MGGANQSINYSSNFLDGVIQTSFVSSMHDKSRPANILNGDSILKMLFLNKIDKLGNLVSEYDDISRLIDSYNTSDNPSTGLRPVQTYLRNCIAEIGRENFIKLVGQNPPHILSDSGLFYLKIMNFPLESLSDMKENEIHDIKDNMKIASYFARELLKNHLDS